MFPLQTLVPWIFLGNIYKFYAGIQKISVSGLHGLTLGLRTKQKIILCLMLSYFCLDEAGRIIFAEMLSGRTVITIESVV